MKEKTTFIKKAWTEQTGGNVMVDYLQLKSGELIGISDDCIVNYGKVENSYAAEEDIFNIYDDKNMIYL